MFQTWYDRIMVFESVGSPQVYHRSEPEAEAEQLRVK